LLCKETLRWGVLCHSVACGMVRGSGEELIPLYYLFIQELSCCPTSAVTVYLMSHLK